MGYPFGEPEYLESYWTLSQNLLARGYAMVISRGPKSYMGNMQFTGGTVITSATTIEPFDQAYIATTIYRKGYKLPTAATDRVINNQDMDAVCVNKLMTYELFSDLMAPCFPINTHNWQEILTKITTERVVLKPIGGQEGNGIVVKMKGDVRAEDMDPVHGAYLAQEFVDSSAGIPGVTDGLHDLRLSVFNNHVGIAEIRVPKKGSYLANIAQGGSLFDVPLDKVPASAFALAERIDERFAKYTPRIYSIDLMYCGEKPYLVELNSQPGIPWREWEQFNNYYSRFHRYILDTLLTEPQTIPLHMRAIQR
jgi:glutathione synthase/RimK-type ligase-like ATP-grasp enzyme